jgi:protein involved in polysaccharide export with SLBB domain
MTAKFRSKSIANGISAAIAVFAIVAPCTAQSAASTTAVAPKSSAPAAASNVAPSVAVPAEYSIGADDVMKVDFCATRELSSRYRAARWKDLAAAAQRTSGSGTDAAQLRIASREAKMEDPSVTVEVKAINSGKCSSSAKSRGQPMRSPER